MQGDLTDFVDYSEFVQCPVSVVIYRKEFVLKKLLLRTLYNCLVLITICMSLHSPLEIVIILSRNYWLKLY